MLPSQSEDFTLPKASATVTVNNASSRFPTAAFRYILASSGARLRISFRTTRGEVAMFRHVAIQIIPGQLNRERASKSSADVNTLLAPSARNALFFAPACFSLM